MADKRELILGTSVSRSVENARAYELITAPLPDQLLMSVLEKRGQFLAGLSAFSCHIVNFGRPSLTPRLQSCLKTKIRLSQVSIWIIASSL